MILEEKKKILFSMIEISDFGISDYCDVLNKQTSLFEKLIQDKKEGNPGNEMILIGEHFPVITVGRRGKDSNILFSEENLRKEGVRIYHIGRGGDVTFHGPGQLILYPILDLEKHKLGVKDYVGILEESVIEVLGKYGIKGERIEGATGVWISKGSDNERKISAIGIKCSRFCTMHGLSLNINLDLSGFEMINPCGFQDKGVTSIQKELDYNSLNTGWVNTSNLSENSGFEKRLGPYSSEKISLERGVDIKEVKKDLIKVFLDLLPC